MFLYLKVISKFTKIVLIDVYHIIIWAFACTILSLRREKDQLTCAYSAEMKLFSEIHRMRLTVLLLLRLEEIFGDCFVQPHCFDSVNYNRIPRMGSSYVFSICKKWDSNLRAACFSVQSPSQLEKCFFREFPVNVCACCLLSCHWTSLRVSVHLLYTLLSDI